MRRATLGTGHQALMPGPRLTDHCANGLSQHTGIAGGTEAQQLQRCGSDIALVISIYVDSLSLGGRIRPDDGDPDLIGALHIVAVAVPVIQSAAAPVIASGDQGGGIAV